MGSVLDCFRPVIDFAVPPSHPDLHTGAVAAFMMSSCALQHYALHFLAEARANVHERACIMAAVCQLRVQQACCFGAEATPVSYACGQRFPRVPMRALSSRIGACCTAALPAGADVYPNTGCRKAAAMLEGWTIPGMRTVCKWQGAAWMIVYRNTTLLRSIVSDRTWLAGAARGPCGDPRRQGAWAVGARLRSRLLLLRWTGESLRRSEAVRMLWWLTQP